MDIDMSPILAMCPWTGSFPPYCFLHNRLFPVHSTEYRVIYNFLCAFHSHNAVQLLHVLMACISL